MAIYSGSSVDSATAPELPLSCYQGQLYLEKAEILRGDSYTKGIKLSLLSGNNNRIIDSTVLRFERKILLGQSAQDISSAIGAPSRVFYKSEDKMRIHASNAQRRVTTNRSDYFFNYFTLGLVSCPVQLLTGLYDGFFWVGRVIRRPIAFSQKIRPSHQLSGTLQL